jgi:hypothetical protein
MPFVLLMALTSRLIGTRFSVAISPKKSQNSCSRAILVGLSSYRII